MIQELRSGLVLALIAIAFSVEGAAGGAEPATPPIASVDVVDHRVGRTGERCITPGLELTLRGEKKREEKKKDEYGQLFERRYGSFERSFTFPSHVDAAHVEAEMADGVLTIRVMKKEEGKQAKIKVKSR